VISTGSIIIVIFGVWTFSCIIHSAGFHFMPNLITEQFSNFGFFNDVVFLRGDLSRPGLGEAYAGHMIISSFYMFVTIPLFLAALMRDMLTRLRIARGEWRLPNSFLLGCGLFICMGAFMLISDSHSSFINADRRFRGMPLWWTLLITTFVWPILMFMIVLALRDPRTVRENWKL